MNPEGLLNKIITGDENALRQLFEQYSQRLYHVAYYYLQAKEPAEEAVLDVIYDCLEEKGIFRAYQNYWAILIYIYQKSGTSLSSPKLLSW